jgi:hypothetical protein
MPSAVVGSGSVTRVPPEAPAPDVSSAEDPNVGAETPGPSGVTGKNVHAVASRSISGRANWGRGQLTRLNQASAQEMGNFSYDERHVAPSDRF